MNWFAIWALWVVFIFTIYLIYFYASKATKWYVYLFVFIGWFLAFSIVILIPVDVYATICDQQITDDQKTIARIMWRVVYWTVFFLCWTILPVIQEFEMAGEFTLKSRLKTAIYRHVRLFVIMGSAGIVLLIYLLIAGKLEMAHLPAFLMALSNCWGLFLIIVLLGYGLVAIPRTLWYKGDCQRMLYYYQFQVANLEEQSIDTKFQMDEVVKLVHAASFQLPSDSHLHIYMERIISECPLEILEHHKSMNTQNSRDTLQELGDVTESRLIELNKQLKQVLAEYKRAQCQWEALLDEAIRQEDIVNSLDSSNRQIVSNLWTNQKCKSLEWLWYCRVHPALCRVLAVIFVACGMLIVLGEITLFIDYPVGVLPLLYRQDYGPTASQLLVLLPLMFVTAWAYSALFNLKLNGFYGLYGNNQTDPSNLAWSAYFLARMAPPLSYNFLLLIKVEGTQYHNLMNLIDIIPVMGTGFSIFFPFLLIVFCALNFFNVYGKCMQGLGMTQFSFADSFAQEKVNEGRVLLSKAREDKERNLGLSSAATSRQNWEMGKMGRKTYQNPKVYQDIY